MSSNARIHSETTPAGQTFTLTSPQLSYCILIDPVTQSPSLTHFGAPVPSCPRPAKLTEVGWHTRLGKIAREFPDHGRGDYRSPGVGLRFADGSTVSQFEYEQSEIMVGKPESEGLPATFGREDEVSTLKITMKEKHHPLQATLKYSVFHPKNARCSAIARSVTMINNGDSVVELQTLMSTTVDLPTPEEGWEMIHSSGEHMREGQIVRRKVEMGIQSIQSICGFSSHNHNPFIILAHYSTTETTGEAYGFSLIYSGSFLASVEQGSTGTVRVSMGLHPGQFSWPLEPGETFQTPECVMCYSSEGIGGLSRQYHSLFRNHLSKSEWTHKPRPVLLNSWEAAYFDFNADSALALASKAADLGVSLFVLDDGWFGSGKHARVNDTAGLGDWTPNPERFPGGFDQFVADVTALEVRNDSTAANLAFGIWVEPEMVNPQSKLYEAHPDWVLHAGPYERTEARSQLVLNLAMVEVQDYIVDAISTLLRSAKITYIKWDLNRGMHEIANSAEAHRYILGLYRVLDTLTTRFPYVLWEGCASGGGRFDPGILQYWCQSWTSDNTDAVDRLRIQNGMSVVYPPSAMGCHVSAVPNHQTHRTTSLEFRAHVALQGGSFGFELDPAKISEEEQGKIPELIALSERVNPFVIHGDCHRLNGGNMDGRSNWPAVMYVYEGSAVVMAYKLLHKIGLATPRLRLAGLDPAIMYTVDDAQYSGAELAGVGLDIDFEPGDYQSRVFFVTALI